MELASSLITGIVAAISALLVKAYKSVSVHEMKTRAREGRDTYERLHRAGSYGGMLSILLWLLAGVFSGLFLLSIVNEFSAAIFTLIAAVFISLVFVTLPSFRVFSVTVRLASLLAPIFSWVLEHLFIIFEPINKFARRHLPFENHTGIYDINDLLDVVDAQRFQPDSRIGEHTLDIASNALTFNYRTVTEITTPISQARMLSADDAIGPILMNELHQSGMAHFPVYENDKTNIVGVLSEVDIIEAKTGGSVRQLMHPDINYIHEDQLLSEVLDDMLVPGRHMFMVVNEFNELVGTATSEDLIRKIVGYRQENDEIAEYEENLQGREEEPSDMPEQEEALPAEPQETSETV